MRSKKLIAALVVTAALALPFMVAAPASAASLPAGDSLYALSCERDNEAKEVFSNLYSVSPADAKATQIGDGSGLQFDCAYQAAYDPTTGNSYYLASIDGYVKLARIDVATGDATVIPWTGDWEGQFPESIAIGKDGKAYAIAGDNLVSLDLATGALHGLGDLDVSGLYGFAVDPTSGIFYALNEYGPAFRIDVSAVTATWLGNVDIGSGLSRRSLQIDTSGAWWIEVDAPEFNYASSEIWTGAAPANEIASNFTFVGPIDANQELLIYARSLLITYPKQLAATGMDATVLIGAGATAALLILMGGAVLVLRRRRAA